MYCSKVFKAQKILASTYLIRPPMLQKKSNDLESMFSTMNTEHQENVRSIKSSWEIKAGTRKLDERIKMERKLKNLDAIDAVDLPDKNYDETLYYISPPVEWNGFETILETAKRSIAENPACDKSVSANLDRISYHSNCPLAHTKDAKTGETVFFLPAYFNTNFEHVQNVNFKSWTTKRRFAI